MRDHCERLGLINEGEFRSYKRPYTIRGNCTARPFGSDEIREVFRMLHKGMTLKDIAYTLGRSYTSIYHCVNRYGGRYGRNK